MLRYFFGIFCQLDFYDLGEEDKKEEQENCMTRMMAITVFTTSDDNNSVQSDDGMMSRIKYTLTHLCRTLIV